MDNIIIPYIEGDGIGSDITPVMQSVVNFAVNKAYMGRKEIQWMEVLAGEKSYKKYNSWLPTETLETINKYKIAIKGPLTTPVGDGIRSINVAIRQSLDLYTCIRPVKYLPGTPSPLKNPENIDMVVFRENSEDIYSGIEWKGNTKEAKILIDYLEKNMDVKTIRFNENCGIGFKNISEEGSKRLIRKAIKYAIDHNRQSVTFVHKGNIMKYTEGAFKNWGYQLAIEEFNAKPIDGGPWLEINNGGNSIVIKDCIADAFLQQILLRPNEYDVIATMNLNGDYISDALAAQVGGIGIAPGANINDSVAVFEATHGTAPKYANLNKVNPCSLILSAEMMLRYINWNEAADLIMSGIENTIKSKTVTYDFARLIDGANLVSTTGFGNAVVNNI